MIVTITLNASLRVGYEAERVDWGAPNRVTRVLYRAGGGGLAVARVLRAFGHDVVAAGLAGGTAGELIKADLGRSGVDTRFTTISGESRRILEVADAERGQTTMLNEPPPYITTEELGRFAADYRKLMTEATVAVLCGSLPASLPPEIYGSLTSYATEAGVPTIIAAEGPALRYGVSRRPALAIPGPDGPPDLPGQAGPAGPGHVDPAALVAAGAGAVAVVSGHDVRAVTAAHEWRATLDGHSGLPASHDAQVAGLIAAVVPGWSWPDTLRQAIALGATADSDGYVDLDAYEMLLAEVTVLPSDATMAPPR
ncbi:MAG TPA: PfkB family carbohydrate kinase [Streptosporangiaceae bacterium]